MGVTAVTSSNDIATYRGAVGRQRPVVGAEGVEERGGRGGGK
jgi:hypothetical protein